MSGTAQTVNVDELLRQELLRHPLGGEVLALADEDGIDVADPAALAHVVAGMGASGGAADARMVLLLAALLDLLARHETRLQRDSRTGGPTGDAERTG